MAITATFSADFTKFNSALKDAQSSLKPLEVSAKGVQAQLKAMATSLSGANIQRQASLAVAAVNSIGGATKLTASEQTKLNATVTEAIAKYAALGQKAPADMIALEKATRQSESALGGISKALGPLAGLFAGAFTVGAITSAVGETIKFAGSLNDLSAKTGISVEALQEFKFAGSAVGVTLDDVSAAVLQMQKHLIGGGDSVVGALGKLHLTFKDLEGLKPEDQFTLIASRLADIKDPALRNATAFELMGKTAANVLPLIAEHLDKAREAARDLGLVLDGDTVNSLDHLGDTWDALKVAGEAVIAKVLVPFAPLLTDMASAALKLTGPLGDLAQLHLGLAHAVIQAELQLNALDIKFAESANVGGIFDKKIGELIDKGVSLEVASYKIAKQIVGVGTAATNAGGPVTKLGQGFKEAGDKAEKTSFDLNAVVDDILKVSNAIDKIFEKDRAEEAKKNAEALQKFSDAINDLTGQSGLDKALFDLDALNAAMKQGGATAEATKKVYDQVGDAINAIITGGAHLTGSIEEQRAQWNRLTQAAADYSALHPIEPDKEALPVVIKLTKDWEKGLGELSQAFANLSQISGGSFGAIAKEIGSIIGAMNLAAKGVGGLKDNFKALKEAGLDEFGNKQARDWKDTSSAILSAAANVLTLVSAMDQATSSSSRLRNTIGGASTGAQIGTEILPGWGTLIGAGVGALIGALRKPALSQDQQALMDREAELQKTYGSLQNIQTLSKLVGVNLSDTWGNESLTNLKTFNEAVDAFNARLAETNHQFALITANGGLASPELIASLTIQAKSGGQVGDQARQAIGQFLQANVDQVTTGLGQIANSNLPLNQAGATAVGQAIQAQIAQMQAMGMSMNDILKALGPTIQTLQQKFKALGIDGGKAFRDLNDQIAFLSDKNVADAVSGIDGIAQVLRGLQNTGNLTQDTFEGLASQIGVTYQNLIKQGYDGQRALRAISPDLQTLWELEKKFGFKVDDATQNLIDQAVASGTVGDDFKSDTDKMKDAIDKLIQKFSDLIDKILGIKPAADAAGTAIGNIPPPPTSPDYHGGGGPTGPGGGSGGPGPRPPGYPPNLPWPPTGSPGSTAARGGYVTPYGVQHLALGGPVGTDTVPTWLTPGEGVLSRVGMRTLGRLNSGASGGSSQPTTVILQVDGREFARAVADVLPGEVRRLGVRVRT